MCAIFFDPLMDGTCTLFLAEAWRAKSLATIRLDKYCPTRFVLTSLYNPAIYGVRQVPIGDFHKCREGEGHAVFSIDIVKRPADFYDIRVDDCSTHESRQIDCTPIG